MPQVSFPRLSETSLSPPLMNASASLYRVRGATHSGLSA